MSKVNVSFPIGLILFIVLSLPALCRAWECNSDKVPFTHQESDYYGSGEYFATCPGSRLQIRCYHYHRHWICEKETTYYWDRNLESAARTACGCSLPEGMAPSSPSVSKEPKTRFHEFR